VQHLQQQFQLGKKTNIMRRKSNVICHLDSG
jgi:hypothetical protein